MRPSQAARYIRERSVHVQSDGCFHGGDLLSHVGATRRQPVSELIDLELLKMSGWLAAKMTPHLFAIGVKMPVLMIQVLRGLLVLRMNGRSPFLSHKRVRITPGSCMISENQRITCSAFRGHQSEGRLFTRYRSWFKRGTLGLQ
jgi:hypothetical protein